jgi:two-component system chemotaxis response regulator CheY
MFNKAELQVVIKTLTHRRDWLVKNLDNPELSGNKSHNQETLTHIESALRKLSALDKPHQNDSLADLNKLSVPQRRQILPPEKIRVLIADDDDTSAEFLTVLLQSLGIKIIDHAKDGVKAISMLFNASPIYDLVLCDWHMPLKNGLDVHTAMRAVERYQDTCFMLVTAINEAKQIRAAIEEGVDDYIAKPIEQNILNRKLARVFPQIKLADA